MKSHRCLLVAAFPWIAFSLLGDAELPSEWKQVQQLKISRPGLIKFSLPSDTSGAARSELEDLRILDDAGQEAPYWIDRPASGGRMVRPIHSFRVSLEPKST